MTVRQPSCSMHGVSAVQFARDMKRFLQSSCLGRWIERSGPDLWSPRSLDVARAYFILWGHLEKGHYTG
jgi:hypothetical protein